jgi:hypothetical protein
LKVIWVYENIERKLSAFSKFNILVMLASASLWKKNHPEDTTVLYCDNFTYDFYNSIGVLSIYDKVEILAFDNGLNKDAFWASSKLEVLSRQTEPVIIMDGDTLVFKRVKDLFSPDEVMVSNFELGRGYYPTGIDPYVRQLTYKTRWKTDSTNVSFLHLPDAQFTQHYANLSLQVMSEFTKMGAPNSKYLIFAEQLLLKHLLDKEGVKHRGMISTAWDCDKWEWSETEKEGLWTIQDSWKYYNHYGPLKQWYKKDSPGFSYKEETDMLRNCINFHKFIDLSTIDKP